ncbi:hypothetical protein [Halorussus sp. AFM4]|uniref:hypothetical protein n=1 Tax=Halorussus sp. AFM4 TaxID=3421651 RepID=UPI003EBA7BDE
MTTSEPFADGPPTRDDEPPAESGDPSTEDAELPVEGADLTPEEFESTLAALLRRAARSDLAAPRSMDVAGPAETTAWMVEITRIDRRR